jgi:exopolyphosphatase/guanosine-5'-triphosphate,3'-diphosphate pyrophosphatase
MDMRDAHATAAQLGAMTQAERAAQPCIGPQRADLVLAGAAILEAIDAEWPSERMRVADRGLREGVLRVMMQAHA